MESWTGNSISRENILKIWSMAAVDNDTRNMVRFNMSHLCLRWDLRNGANSIHRGRLDNLTFNQVVRGSNPRTLTEKKAHTVTGVCLFFYY